jgi:hypothetical protein
MNTIDHRKNCKELIDNLDKSMERLNTWLRVPHNFGNDGDAYNSLLKKCIEEDIISLMKEIEKIEKK